MVFQISLGPPSGGNIYYLMHLALSRRVHIDQNGGGSNNLELIEVHTDSLVAVEAVKVVLHQFEPVRPYF